MISGRELDVPLPFPYPATIILALAGKESRKKIAGAGGGRFGRFRAEFAPQAWRRSQRPLTIGGIRALPRDAIRAAGKLRGSRCVAYVFT